MQTGMDFLIEVIREPAIFLGLIALTGLLLLRKDFSSVVSGTAKTVIGVVILTQGTNILMNSIAPLTEGFNVMYNIDNPEVAPALGADTILSQYGTQIGLAMLIAFLINLVVARFTPIKHVFLTGHMLFWFPFIFVAVGIENDLSNTQLVLFASILTALYIIIAPALLRPFVRKVTQSDDFIIGHPTTILSLIAGMVGKLFGTKGRSSEDIKFPSSTEFLREISITSSIVMFFVYIVVSIIIGFDTASTAFGAEQNLVIYSVMQGILFGAGLTVLLLGVRMMLAEIIPAFQGISQKWIPNAVPALDAPILFPYAPNAVLIGFVVSMITSVATIFITGSMGVFSFVIVPLTITCFFEIGTAAIIANGQGGLRGAIAGSAVAGVVMILLVGLSVPILSGTAADWIVIFGGNDFSLWSFLGDLIARLFPGG
ncbi:MULTISPECIES: PTS ascorbate transporter subunit IIC [Shouchella]|uniref:Ascorbate-specific PTS system EIIC component n=3 Tax=Bacillaceae TaxID=186817 RepID=A0A060LY23_9BACI|nr:MULTISPECIES: PTS ascorbate transporter subunit IIC [Bacillaceae]RQW22754.1 PTS ascorbate transporter subunit IIC [Bacillus sp. C1-1]AIC93193.1 ascorbate-specific phosphotransferase system enzyme IIC [Shouchella lehensis G1]KQL55989.1 PTS ascorbate transporter subunit IIC [Alkalicoccobacillus plakortidis]MBG9783042.1 PTS ascorbate transporter subunit IIC [Shouchella lehensis]TES49602.1 PTS ascorbate transporter subunit IIC [Shouchella lehensis]